MAEIIRLCSEKVSLAFTVEKTVKCDENGGVYIVRNRESKRRYIYREYVGNSEVYEKLQDVSSSYLPKIFAVEKHEDKVCVVEEYMQGDTLSFIMEGGKIPDEMAGKIAVQICCALEVLHRFGAVHRDVKPENIILSEDRAVLIDFDVSRINKAGMSNDTMVMGATGYAAPEQYGFAQTDSRADIYAFGVMLNEMLVKKHPSQQIAGGCFRAVIEKCIETNVNNRYKDASELKNALENCVGRKDTTVTKKKYYITVAAVAVCAFLMLFFMVYRHNENMSGINLQLIQSKDKISSLQKELIQKEMEILDAGKKSSMLVSDIQIKQELWQGKLEAYSTTFYYDLDADGYGEECNFGVWFGRMYFGDLTYIERNGVAEGSDCPVEIMPAVWKITADGTPAILYGPTYNIFDAKVEVWRVDEWGEAEAPVVQPLGDVFDSGVKMTFLPEHAGTYLFRVTGEVNGEKMSGQAIMEIIAE